MKFRFRNSAVVLAAAFAFSACSNNGDNLPSVKAEDNDLSVKVSIPTAKALSRGVMDAGVTGDALNPKVRGLKAIVMDGNIEKESLVLKLNADGKSAEGSDEGAKVSGNNSYSSTELVYTFDFKDIPLKGSEQVKVVANYSEGALLVKDVQPLLGDGTKNDAGIYNAVYSGSAGLIKAEDKYTSTMDVTSDVARVEIYSNLLFKKELVKELRLEHVTPVQYRTDYADPINNVFKPEIKGDDQAVRGDLWFDFAQHTDALNEMNVTEEGKINKVLANHLFEGDVQRVAIGIRPVVYDCMMTTDGKYLLHSEGQNTEQSNYIYKHEEANVIFIGDVAYTCTVEYNEADNTLAVKNKEKSELKLSELKTLEQDLQFFTLYGFNKATDNNKGLKKDSHYVGGNVYTVSLSENIFWNDGGKGSDGKDKNPNEFNPEDNKGTDQPDKREKSDIYVTATVKAWSQAQYNVSVE